MKTALYSLHKELGATFTEFMGYEMPLKYTSINEEHMNVRHNVGIFDVSHMGKIFLEENAEKINRVITGDAKKIARGMGNYTLLLNKDGNIIDDEVFFHIGKEFLFIPNAGMSKKMMEWFEENGIDARDAGNEYSILAVQGRYSADVMNKITDFDVNSLKFFECADIGKKMKIDTDARVIVSRSGYTGEKGYELYISPSKEAIEIFRSIMQAGKEYNIMPCGLGARDSLRLEKGYMLATNEFKGGRNPFEVGMEWAIDWNHDFVGKESLIKLKDKVKEKLAYLKCIDNGIPRHGDEVWKEGEKIGTVSSGGYSPCLRKGIAMAFVRKEEIHVGNVVEIAGRRKIRAEMVNCPFVKKGEC